MQRVRNSQTTPSQISEGKWGGASRRRPKKHLRCGATRGAAARLRRAARSQHRRIERFDRPRHGDRDGDLSAIQQLRREPGAFIADQQPGCTAQVCLRAGKSRCSWPRKSSSARGRMRSARGAETARLLPVSGTGLKRLIGPDASTRQRNGFATRRVPKV